MSYTVPPETMLPSSITEARLCKGPVAARPDGKPATSIFKLQVKNSQGRPQDIQLQVNGSIANGIGFWDNATNRFERVKDMVSLPVSVESVSLSIGIESARLYGTPEATETSARDYATLQCFQAIQKYNVLQAAPEIYKKMPYLPAGTIEGSPGNFTGTCIIGEPLVNPDGTPNPPYRVDDKTGRQYVKSLSIAIQLYLKKDRVAGQPFEVDKAVLRKIVGWDQLPGGARKPITEVCRDWTGLLKWGATGVVKGKFSPTSITKENKASAKFTGVEFFFEESTRGAGGDGILGQDVEKSIESMVWA